MPDFEALVMTLDITYVAEIVSSPGVLQISYNDPSGEEQVNYMLQIGDPNGLAPFLQRRLEQMIEAKTITIHQA